MFETFFAEFPFHFSAADTTTPYNSQATPDALDPEGTGAFYATFDVDASALDPYVLHFDLYNGKLAEPRGKASTDAIDVDLFAPFSHDAEGGRRRLPVPATAWRLAPVILLGFVRASKDR